MTFEEILDELDNVLLDAGRIPFTNKRILEEDDVAKLIDELREALPEQLAEANRVLKDRQHIIDEAHQEAQNIIEQAKSYTLKITDESQIAKQAQEQANEILLQAQKRAQALQQDAVAYADNVFKHIEAHVEKALQVVHQGHNDLHQSDSGKSKPR